MHEASQQIPFNRIAIQFTHIYAFFVPVKGIIKEETNLRQLNADERNVLHVSLSIPSIVSQQAPHDLLRHGSDC